MSFQSRTLSRIVLAANSEKPRAQSRLLTVPSFFASWLASEAAAPLVALDALDTVNFLRKGGHKSTGGKAAIAARLAASAMLARQVLRGRSTDTEFEEELTEFRLGGPVSERPRTDRRADWLPFFFGGRDVRVEHDVEFAHVDGVSLKLDLYLPPEGKFTGPRPTMLYFHGGAWVIGDKREQGLIMMRHLAANGWICATANYRLSPKVKAPTHLLDCKRALIWMREHTAEYGGDPDFIAVSGGSAGGHLAALVALTANDPEFDPEECSGADTSVAAAVPFYGVYDMSDRAGHTGGADFLRLMERYVMGKSIDAAPDAYAAYSPFDQVHPEAPPFLIIHGALDILVPVASARDFRDRLRASSKNPVLYVELEHAQHAFDVFPSPRSVRTIEWVEQFLAECWERYSLAPDAAADSSNADSSNTDSSNAAATGLGDSERLADREDQADAVHSDQPRAGAGRNLRSTSQGGKRSETVPGMTHIRGRLDNSLGRKPKIDSAGEESAQLDPDEPTGSAQSGPAAPDSPSA